MKTPYNPHFGKNDGPRRYRYISLVAPMASHDTQDGRQHNMKLYYVLRWYLYTQTPGSSFFCISTASVPLPHGGLCLRAHCAISQADYLNSTVFRELLRVLKDEQLTPCLYMFDGYADGADKTMPTIVIADTADKTELRSKDIVEGRSLNRSHIPWFARQMLHYMKNKPVSSITCDEESYLSHFGFTCTP